MMAPELQAVLKRIEQIDQERQTLVDERSMLLSCPDTIAHCKVRIGDDVKVTRGWSHRGKTMRVESIRLAESSAFSEGDGEWYDAPGWRLHGHVLKRDGSVGLSTVSFVIRIDEEPQRGDHT